MYGPGPAPSAGRDGARITVRVLFAVGSILSCGLLACVPLFAIAFLRERKRWYDWTLAGLSLPASIGAFAVVGSLPETDHRTDAAMVFLLSLGAAGAVYYLVFDMSRSRRQQSLPAPYFPPAAQGYTPPVPPQPGHSYGYPSPPVAVPAPPKPLLPPARAGHPRIDQVRAELDELSDILRKGEDGR
jgi:hypothetical protein